MQSNNIVVITTARNLSDVKLPIDRSELDLLIDTSGVFSHDQERAIIQWANDVSVSGLPFPIDEERRKAIDDGGRTSKLEDMEIAKWVLEVWDVIERWRHYA